jgi:signal transduction histidine kinase
LKFKSSLLARKLEERSLPEAGEARSFVRALEQAIQLGYDLSRGLQPVLLVREGLVCALEELASSTGALFNVACRFRACGAGKIQSQTVVTHLYRLAQEAVANAIKHSHGSRVRVLLVEGKKQVFLCVSDNGTGFAVGRRGGLGLSIMQHRARVIGASLQIRPRPGGGTRVVCILPKSAAHATGAKS